MTPDGGAELVEDRGLLIKRPGGGRRTVTVARSGLAAASTTAEADEMKVSALNAADTMTRAAAMGKMSRMARACGRPTGSGDAGRQSCVEEASGRPRAAGELNGGEPGREGRGRGRSEEVERVRGARRRRQRELD